MNKLNNRFIKNPVFTNPELCLPGTPVDLYQHTAGFFLFISQLQLSFPDM